MVGVLFKMNIDPSISSIPFASVAKISAFETEEEILFSMHAVFRISQVKEIEDRLWQVELRLISDDDQELSRLTDYLQKEIQGLSAYHRLGELLLRMGNFERAEEACERLCEDISEDNSQDLSYIYDQLGRIKNGLAEYEKHFSSIKST
jgi:Flp pilus assembly protein TadD